VAVLEKLSAVASGLPEYHFLVQDQSEEAEHFQSLAADGGWMGFGRADFLVSKVK